MSIPDGSFAPTREDMQAIERVFAHGKDSLTSEDLNQLFDELWARHLRDLDTLLSKFGGHLRAQHLGRARSFSMLERALPRLRLADAAPLFIPVMASAQSAIPAEHLSHPSQDEFEDSLRAVRLTWSEPVVDTFIATLAFAVRPVQEFAVMQVRSLIDGGLPLDRVDAPAEPEEPQFLFPTVRDSESSDGNDRLEPISLPSIEEEVYTPLGRVLISAAVATAHGSAGALDPEDFAGLVTEYMDISPNHMPAWWLEGFAEGLGITSPESRTLRGSEEPARRYWRLWGLLKAYQRLDSPEAVASAEKLVQEQLQQVVAMLEAHLAPEMLPYILRRAIGNNPAGAAKLLAAAPVDPGRPIAYELETARLVDDASVALLQTNRSADALAVLRGAIVRLASVVEERERSGQRPLRGLADLKVRLTIGIAAAHRQLRDFSSAISTLDQFDESDLRGASPRTMARYLVQVLLSKIHEIRVQDIRIPRNSDEREAFRQRLGPYSGLLEAAIKANRDSWDAHYILGCLHLASGDLSAAQRELSIAGAGYAIRSDRAYQRPHLLWQVLLLDLLIPGGIPADEAIDRMAAETPSEISVSREEAQQIVRAVVTKAPHRVDAVVELLADRRHGTPEAGDLQLLIDAGCEISQSLISIINRVPGLSTRIGLLTQAFAQAHGRGAQDQQDAALDAIDQIRSQGNSSVHVSWANALLSESSVRDYMGASHADMSAAGEIMECDNASDQTRVLLEVATRLQPIQTPQERVNLDSVLDDLELLDSVLADELRNDPLSAVPQQYVGWHVGAPLADDASDPISILFVGGMEERNRETLASVRASLHEKYGDKLLFDFTLPGWSSGWAAAADRVESRFDGLDGVVVHRFVRTNFGRRIRRSASEAGLVRSGCQQIGQQAIIEAVERCMRLVRDGRTRHDGAA